MLQLAGAAWRLPGAQILSAESVVLRRESGNKDSSWRQAQFLRHKPTAFPSPPTENKSDLSTSSKLCLHIFHLASVNREGLDFGRQQSSRFP